MIHFYKAYYHVREKTQTLEKALFHNPKFIIQIQVEVLTIITDLD